MSRTRRLRKRFQGSREEAQAAQETEQALVSALQDSDTPGELLHDELEDAADPATDISSRSPRGIRRFAAAAVLAVLALLVARRRR